MHWLLAIMILVSFSSPASAGELLGTVGLSGNMDSAASSYGFQTEYREGLAENLAISISHLNEGHFPQHHRDGLAPFTLWGRVNLLERQLSLAAGAGPYLYADTINKPGETRNDHGVGGLLGVSATWYFKSRMMLQTRVNYVVTKQSIDTVTALAGIGYQLDAPATPGPLASPPRHRDKVTSNELTLFLGQTVVNNPGSPKSVAWSIEYRRGLLPYLDVTATWLNEGDNQLIRRNGAISQLWMVREFLDDYLSLGVGFGAYVSLDKRGGLHPLEGGNAFASGILSATACLHNFSFSPDLSMRLLMNRIVTNYHKDTDVFMVGLGYRF